MNSKTKWQLFVDGASRNNPGPAGAGIYLTKDHKKELAQGFFLGNKTNNQAEYLALLIGLIITLPKIKQDHLQIVSDSLLLVNQLNGLYRVKNPELQILYHQVLKLLKNISYDVIHVLREKNKLADEMANFGIDHQIALTSEIKEKLHEAGL